MLSSFMFLFTCTLQKFPTFPFSFSYVSSYLVLFLPSTLSGQNLLAPFCYGLRTCGPIPFSFTLTLGLTPKMGFCLEIDKHILLQIGS